MNIIGWFKYQVAHWKWSVLDYPKPGDPLHGKGESRKELRAALVSRWLEREPKKENY